MSDQPGTGPDTPPALYRAVQAELRVRARELFNVEPEEFDLGEWILALRASRKSFPEIGYLIRDAIGQYVSHETLRRWAREAESSTHQGGSEAEG